MKSDFPSLREKPFLGLARSLLLAGLLFLITFDAVAQTAAASNSGPICTGADIMLFETGGSAVSWVWSTSGLATFNNNTLQNPTARGAVNGEIFTVTITDLNNRKATANTTVVVYSAPPARPGPISGNTSPCQGSSGNIYSISPVSNTTSYLWQVPAGWQITSGQGTVSITVTVGLDLLPGTVRVSGVNSCGTGDARTRNVSASAAPGAAGPISGQVTFTPGTNGITYSIASVTGATSYLWGYTGTGVTINGTGTSVTLDFSVSATPGQLSVRGTSVCGQGASSTLDLSPAAKTLTLTSVLLEGLYNGGGAMRQAIGSSGPQWGVGIADHITVELHNAVSYSTIVWSATGIPLSTAGTAVVTVPAVYGGSYYVTVKHRNSIETTSASPVSFAGTGINISFSSAAAVYGANLKASVDGYFLLFGGDVNQDGFVDSGDYPAVVNGNFNYLTGYLPADINGDGFIDSGDYPIMVNNNFKYVGTIHP